MPYADQRARSLAKKSGLIARKSRSRRGTIDNRGGFTLLEPSRNIIVAGERCDMTAEEVIEFCLERLMRAN